jgi:hypothetical protein
MGAALGGVCATREADTNRHKPAIEEWRMDMEKVYPDAGMGVKGSMLNE